MKEKKILIGGKEIPLKTSAYTPLLYANLFNANIFAEMQDIITAAANNGSVPFEKVITLYRLAYCMAKHADPKLPPMDEWMDQFDVYDIPEIAGELIELWAADASSQSTPKDETEGD